MVFAFLPIGATVWFTSWGRALLFRCRSNCTSEPPKRPPMGTIRTSHHDGSSLQSPQLADARRFFASQMRFSIVIPHTNHPLEAFPNTPLLVGGSARPKSPSKEKASLLSAVGSFRPARAVSAELPRVVCSRDSWSAALPAGPLREAPGGHIPGSIGNGLPRTEVSVRQRARTPFGRPANPVLTRRPSRAQTMDQETWAPTAPHVQARR